MKKSAVLAFSICIFLSLPAITAAQISLSSLTARAGIIRTQWPDGPIFSNHLWSFYPELEAGGAFIVPYLSWGLSWGYWTDGIDQALPVADMVTYSQSSHVMAARIGFHPDLVGNKMPVPLTLFAGVAEHFTSLSYVGGTGLDGNRGQSSKGQSTTGLIGLSLSFPILSHLNLEAEALQYISFGNTWIDNAQKNRQAFKCGAEVIL